MVENVFNKTEYSFLGFNPQEVFESHHWGKIKGFCETYERGRWDSIFQIVDNIVFSSLSL